MDIVKMAMREAHERRQTGQPIILGGYSNGGTLSLKYAIDCQSDPSMPCPDAILLLSPAIKVSPFAIFARLHLMVSWLDYFEQFQWESVYPEIDPYKYTSFPKSAGWETADLTDYLKDFINKGDLHLPPILAFQSVVDSTVDASALLQLFRSLSANRHHLVFYDTNRTEKIVQWIKVRLVNPDDVKLHSPYNFSISLLTNMDSSSRKLQQKTIVQGAVSFEVHSTSQRWPRDIYSLSHVALPFPADDPVYGKEGFAVGAQALRGEKQVMYLSPDYFLRLRYNPFHKWQEEKIGKWLQSSIDK